MNGMNGTVDVSNITSYVTCSNIIKNLTYHLKIWEVSSSVLFHFLMTENHRFMQSSQSSEKTIKYDGGAEDCNDTKLPF